MPETLSFRPRSSAPISPLTWKRSCSAASPRTRKTAIPIRRASPRPRCLRRRRQLVARARRRLVAGQLELEPERDHAPLARPDHDGDARLPTPKPSQSPTASRDPRKIAVRS